MPWNIVRANALTALVKMRVGLALAAFTTVVLVSGCKSGSSNNSSSSANPSPGPGSGAARESYVESLLVDGGSSDAGPNCSGSGDPLSGLDGGSSGSTCLGILGQSTFTRAVCSCGSITMSSPLTTDGFNSALGGPDGGLGGGVASDLGEVWSNTVTIGGDFVTPGTLNETSPGIVRGNFFLGGSANISASLTIDGDASVVPTLPKTVTVLGKTSHVSSVASPCNCTNLVPIASIVAAHRPPANDDATVGLSATAATGSGTPARIDLPCGSYYLTRIGPSTPLTIAVHGHTALYVDGDVQASASLSFQIDPTATLDLFVAGNLNASGPLTLGSTSHPASCRAYVAGATVELSTTATIACNMYTPSALFGLTGAPTLYGSLFVGGLTVSAPTTIHYDEAIQNASGECCSATTCDDGNPCTVDSCNGDGTCSHTPAANGLSCAGTNECERTYACQAGACVGSNPVTCTASDSCHVAGTCNPSTGACSNPTAPNGTSCSDGNACTQSDSCQSGVCTGSNPVTCAASDACHVAGTCNPSTGACSNPVAANGTSCSDGNACTQTDACENGTCTGSNPVTCLASDACHVAGTCNPSTGACSNPTAANGAACSDGNACTRADACENGVCTGSNPVTCAASDACHVAGTCNPSTGACSNPTAANGTSCSDGNACTQSDSCQSGVCTGSNPVTCAASDACHVAGTCNPSTGACSNPTAANGTSCSDGNACTQSDSCQSGVCTGSNPVTCAASDACHVAGTCNPSTGACSNPTAANGTSCSDGNACTQSDSCQSGVCTGSNPVACAASDACHVAGTCNPSTGACSNPTAANGTSCSDGNACTQSDSCQSGVCTGSNPVTCAASDACHVAGTCNPSTGACSNPTAANGTSCSDGNACTQSDSCQSGVCTGSNPVTCAASDACHMAGTCNPSTGACSNPTAANGTSCSDGNACTQSDSCQSGVCTGSNPVTCAASDACHVAGTCNPSTGACSNPTAANGTSCSDGNACTQSDSCQSGVCTGSNPVTCAASDACHVAGTCSPSTGACSNPTAANGTSCSDGNACTQSDSCQSGVCTGSNPVTCAASDACHMAGTCNPSTGACSNPTAANGTSCSDGNACTQSDSCQSGVCTGSNPVTCAASDACHMAGTCNPSTGACSNPTAANGTSCSDGNACTQSDSCQSGVCTGSNPVTCAASDACHVAGTCNPSTGACSNPVAANGTSCSDGNACTQNDTCQAGACAGGPVLTCAADACHAAGVCDPIAGCSSAPVPDGTPCSGANKCNQVYACTAGTCTGSSPVTCTPSDACHAAGTCDPGTGSCSNPTAADGTSCNDGNACTQSDSCRSGTCVGGNPVSCAALDVCHVAGSCNPATGTCSNPNAPDGKSCGTTDASQGQVCSGGACGVPTACTSNQTQCSGVCANTQTDPNNCGSCGNSCAARFSCIVGTCVPPAIAASCLPSSSLAVLAGPDGVTAYVPNGSWNGLTGFASTFTGVLRVALEGGAAPVTIPTPNAVNSCSSNWVTGQTVCTSNGTDVYIISGSELTATLTSGATALEGFSGGSCLNCGVAFDSSANKAILSLGLAVDPSLVESGATGGFQFLDLATNTFEPPISAGLPVKNQSNFTSEDISVDPFRHLVLSANEIGDYQLLQTQASPTVSDFQFSQPSFASPPFDASAEDCSTGIAVASIEVPANITLVDLTQAVFVPGSPNGTWSAPTSSQALPELDTPGAEPTGIAIAPGSHLGLLTPEKGGTKFGVFQLPSTSGSGIPALVDWASVVMPNDPSGATWQPGLDPHTVTAYMSPSTNRPFGFIANAATVRGPTFMALIDLQAILDLPRVPGTHNVDSTYDLVGHGAITFITAPCDQTKLTTDPVNCGFCGTVCPAGPNALPTCSGATCRTACTTDFADCNHVATDGCEVNISTDPANCGACGTSCAEPNATGVCSAGHCAAVCNTGFNDCDGVASNGCETAGPCGAPTVTVTGPTSAAAGDTPLYVATATDPVPGRTLTFTWSALSGPAAVTFSAPSALMTTADFSAPGTYVVQFAASDGFATTVADLSVNVVLINQPPVVTVGPDQTLTSPVAATTLVASATDDGLPQGGALSSTWSLLSGPVAVAIASPTQSGLPEPGPIVASTGVTFSYPGTYVFQLAVSDGDLVGVATETVTVNPPPAETGSGGTTGGGTTGGSTGTTGGGTGTTPSAPTVAIGGVTDDQEVTQPTPILATVSDGAWVLEWRLGGRDDVQTPWAVMASGTGAVSGSTIATFDPTLLLNGIYTLRLSSENTVGSASTSVSLSVDGRMKVGFFTLTFTDLSTVVGALPLTVTRTYDSRDKTVGDFGVGWKLGISDVRVEKSGETGAFWTQQFIDEQVFSEFCLSPSQASSVAITFPNGRQYRFVPQASPQCQAEFENTAPDITWVSTSDPDNPTIQLFAADETSVFANDVGNGVTQLQDDNGDIWDPRQFTLTIEDGSVWQIDQDLGVTAVQDRNGNTLTITPNGIVHSSGERVTFVRDTQGRITTMTDPAGASMTYVYDGDGDLATYTDRLSNVTQFTYEANHYLDQILDPLGRMPVRNDYDASGRLLSTTDASGNTVHYNPNLSANQDQVTDRLGHVTLYTYNDRGDVTQKVDATGAVWNYTFDIRGNKLTETDPLGHTTTSTYDGADDLLTQTDALGNVTTNTYDLDKDLLTTTDPLGHVTTNVYEGNGNVVQTTDPVGDATRYTYDAEGNRLTKTDALNNVSTYAYDIGNHLIQMTDASGQTTSYTYDANGNKTSESANRTDFLGDSVLAVTSYQYDASGHLTQTAGRFTCAPLTPCPATRSTTYTATGKRATDTDELGRVTSYAYDVLDRLITTTRPDGSTVSQTYDAENHRTSSTDASGNPTNYTYDPLGRLLRTTFADGSSTSTAYDAAGNAVQSADELGHVRWTAYDAANRRAGATDPLGATTQYAYDAAGNQASMIDALGHTTGFAYDAANRPVATVYADGTADATRYDADGRVVTKIDALGRTTNYGYDAMGRLVTVKDALQQVTQYTYNGFGERLSQTDANRHTTDFTIDVYSGRETGRVLPDGSTENRLYDAAGEVVQRTDFAGRSTAYAYDAMGRQLSRTYPDKTGVAFTYTPDGLRATETDARGTTAYAYDARRRAVQMTYPDGRALTYGYDVHGDRTSVTAKIGSQSWTTTTGYDADERPNQVKDALGRAFALSYDADGNRTAITYPNATSTAYAYDVLNRLTNLTTQTTGSSPSTVQSSAYMLDEAGRRTQVAEADGTVRAYGYDGIDRLTSEAVTGPLTYTKAFAYDAVGNRTTQTTTGASADLDSYSYDSRDRLTSESDGTTSYAYDVNGNVTSKSGEASYAWDFENRLTSVGMASGTNVAHEYDVDGNRVQTAVTSSAGAVTTNLLVDRTGSLSQVVAESDASASLTALYVRVGDELLEVMRPGSTVGAWTTRFVHHDGLGSVRGLTDETGTIVDSRAYDAFGTKNVEAGSDPLTYGFAGEPFEPTSLLAYHRARWMDARVGRFAGMDVFAGVLRSPLSLHRYLYGSANPVNHVDATGFDDLADVSASIDIIGIEATEATPVINGTSVVAEAQGNIELAELELDEAEAEIDAEADIECAGGSCEGSGACFASETKVATAYGERPISEIKVGDFVWSEDPAAGTPVLSPVTERFVTPMQPLVDLEIVYGDATSEVLRVTPTHRFWIEGKGWIPAADIHTNDAVRLLDGATAIVGAEVPESSPATVYNIEVDANHSYFVGSANTLVHNACNPDKLAHIFGQVGKHLLQGLVQQFGGEQAAFDAVEIAAQQQVSSQGTQGVFEFAVDVGGNSITVRGIVIDGIARIGTFFIPAP